MLGDPAGHGNTDRVSGRPNLAVIGRIQSEGKPCSFRHSGPLNHRTPSASVTDEILATDTDETGCILGQETIGRPSIRWP